MFDTAPDWTPPLPSPIGLPHGISKGMTGFADKLTALFERMSKENPRKASTQTINGDVFLAITLTSMVDAVVPATRFVHLSDAQGAHSAKKP